MTGHLLIGLDIGTSGVDACAFTPAGRVIAGATIPLATRRPRPGWVEQDATAWVGAAFVALRQLTGHLGPAMGAVAAVGLAGQCPSLTLADDAGTPLTAGILYADNRATAEAAYLGGTLGPARVRRRAGMLPAPFHAAPKAMWLGAHHPELRAGRPWLAQPRDLVWRQLTGSWGTDATHAGCTLLYDLGTGTWAGDWVESLGLGWLRLPPVLPTTTLGRLTPNAADETGLPAGLPMVLGAADNFCADLGLGAVVPGLLGDSSGTSTCLDLTIAGQDLTPALSLYAHFTPGLLFANTGLNATGATMVWAAGALAGGDLGRLEQLATEVPPDLHAPLLLPYLDAGERTDAAAVGAWYGLCLSHGPARLARSVYEGLTFALGELVDQYRAAGHPIDRVHVGGGGSRSLLWNGMKADVWNLPVLAAGTADATALGAAMLAGIAVGLYRDPADAATYAVHLGPIRAPDVDQATLYREVHGRWRSLKERGS